MCGILMRMKNACKFMKVRGNANCTQLCYALYYVINLMECD